MWEGGREVWRLLSPPPSLDSPSSVYDTVIFTPFICHITSVSECCHTLHDLRSYFVQICKVLCMDFFSLLVFGTLSSDKIDEENKNCNRFKG